MGRIVGVRLGTHLLICMFENGVTGWNETYETHVPVCTLRN